MTGAVVTAMDRFAAVTTDPQTMEVVGQRVMDGESLKQIAISWQVPVVRFVDWIVNDLAREQQYAAALKVRAEHMVSETIAIADGVDEARVVKDEAGKEFVLEPDTKRDALRVRTRLTVAGHYDRQRYGSVTTQNVNVMRKHASEMTDEQLMAIIDNAVRDARAIEGQSTEVLRRAELPAPEELI